MANCYFELEQFDKACLFWKKALDNGYNYKPEWKEIYGISDPIELIKDNCE